MPLSRLEQRRDARVRRQGRALFAAKRNALAPLLLTLAACTPQAEPPPVPAPATLRTIGPGRVIGTSAENGAHVWREIPYAAPTAGPNRWRAPRPARPWEGVREAVAFGDRCAQLTNAYDEDEGLAPGRVVGSEDCHAEELRGFALPAGQRAATRHSVAKRHVAPFRSSGSRVLAT